MLIRLRATLAERDVKFGNAATAWAKCRARRVDAFNLQAEQTKAPTTQIFTKKIIINGNKLGRGSGAAATDARNVSTPPIQENIAMLSLCRIRSLRAATIAQNL